MVHERNRGHPTLPRRAPPVRISASACPRLAPVAVIIVVAVAETRSIEEEPNHDDLARTGTIPLRGGGGLGQTARRLGTERCRCRRGGQQGSGLRLQSRRAPDGGV